MTAFPLLDRMTVIHSNETLPRTRYIGDLRLDLFLREGFVNQRRLGLHPMEFGLIWRLADDEHAVVSRRELLADVWQVHHELETNTVAVHVCRVREKLAACGITNLIKTHENGGYYLFEGEI